jgi:outer membrane protein assembly factor BamB
MPLSISKEKKLNQVIWIISSFFIIIVLFSSVFLFLGLTIFRQNGRPNFGKLPFLLNWEISNVSEKIRTVVTDGASVFLFSTDNVIVKYDLNQSPLWRTKKLPSWKDITNMLVDEGYLYYDDSEFTYSVNKITGETFWSTKHPDGLIASSKILKVTNDQVFVELYDHGLFVLDKITGELIWKIHYTREYADLFIVDNDAILLITNHILIYDIKSGKILKDIRTGIKSASSINNGFIFYSEENDQNHYELRSYDPRTGEIQTIFISKKRIFALEVDNESIYINTDLKIIKLSKTGEVFWEYNYPNAFCTSFYPSRKILLVFDNQGSLFGIDPESGSYIDAVKNYHFLETAKYSIIKNEKIEIFLANDHDIFQYIEK